MTPEIEDSWKKFETTGRVTDYLLYCKNCKTAQTEREDTEDEPKERSVSTKA